MARYDLDAIRRDNSLAEEARKRFKLTRNGREWTAPCPFHSEKSPSFTIFTSRGSGVERFHCFGCGAHGDVVDFVMRHDGVDLPTAAAILGGQQQRPDRAPERRAPAAPSFDPMEGWQVAPVPDVAPLLVPGQRTPPLFNPKRQEEPGAPVPTVRYEPTLVHPYMDAAGRLLGYVLRVDIGRDRKITPAIFWARGPRGEEGWTHIRPERPTPLYGLDELAARPDAQVVVVEGEKAADAARRLLGRGVAVVTWMGGTQGVPHADWTPLHGRKVVLWGDADQPGEHAMLGSLDPDTGEVEEGVAHLCRAAEVKVAGWDTEREKGWDAADAEAEGMDRAAVLAWIKSRVYVWTPDQPIPARARKEAPPPPAAPEPAAQAQAQAATVTQLRQVRQEKPQPADELAPAAAAEVVDMQGRRLPDDWRATLVYGNDFKPKPKSLQNIVAFMRHHDDLRGLFAYNDFAHRLMVTRRPPWAEDDGRPWVPREADEVDAIMATGWLERLELGPKVGDTQAAIMTAARDHAFNPVRDYMDRLVWDGVPRLAGDPVDEAREPEEAPRPGWLTRYLGVPDTPIVRAFGLRWLISGVARVYQPGCKVDTMLVLEGGQGLRKSTALEVLATLGGQRFFTDDVGKMGEKDTAMQLQGVLIAEEAELDSMGRSEVKSVKAFMARRIDRFRPPFGKLVKEFPRQCIFGGTVNPGSVGYLQDETGNRRVWPVTCRPVVGEHVDIQGLTEDRDQLWAEAVHRYREGERWWLDRDEEEMAREVQDARMERDVWEPKVAEYLDGRDHALIDEILTHLGVKLEHQGQVKQKRVGKVLRMLGWVRDKRRIGLDPKTRWAYFPPEG